MWKNMATKAGKGYGKNQDGRPPAMRRKGNAARYAGHPLKADWADFRDGHIEPV